MEEGVENGSNRHGPGDVDLARHDGATNQNTVQYTYQEKGPGSPRFRSRFLERPLGNRLSGRSISYPSPVLVRLVRLHAPGKGGACAIRADYLVTTAYKDMRSQSSSDGIGTGQFVREMRSPLTL